VAGATFPRNARLLSPEEFSRALKTRPFRGKFLWVYRVDSDAATAAKRDATEATNSGNSTPATLANLYCGPQLGMMIGKRNAKTAVLRNAIKRRLREQFRLRAPRLPMRAYVVRLSAIASKADVPLIVGEWVSSLEFDIRKNSAHSPVKLAATS
jgi:ribonuclease P protein component